MKHLVCGLMAAVMLAVPASAVELTLTLGGHFYEGAPSYEIVADGRVVATGTVAAEQDDVVHFEVGEPTTLAIRYTNDLAAKVGPDGTRPPGADRNLIIQAVAYGDQTWKGVELAGAKGVARAKDFAIVSIKQTVEIPIGGDVAFTVPGPLTKPAVVETAAVPDTAVQQTPGGCEPLELHLTGYEDGKLLPTEKALAALDQLFTATGCTVIITGYSSVSGTPASNKKMAQRRADAIYEYLVGKGAVFAQSDVEGWGETELFGSDEASNRRVVVSVH